jgi:ketosteroid isomerase-like protein
VRLPLLLCARSRSVAFTRKRKSLCAPIQREILRRPMSQENVELVRKGSEDWNRGDMDAWFALFDDDAVLRAAEGWPERDFRGKDAVRSFYEGFAETVGRDSVIEDLIDAGDVVVTRVRAHMTGVHSGLEGDMRFTQVTTFRKGKVVLNEFFWDHHEALEAAGRSE